MTVWAQVIGPRYIHLTDSGEDWLAAQLAVVRLMAATTGKAPLFDSRARELQQLAEGGGAGTMHGRAYRGFEGFQIHTPSFAAGLEDDPQQLLYFAGDFLADRFGGLFSSGVIASSTSRARQILSLISSSSWLSCRKR